MYGKSKRVSPDLRTFFVGGKRFNGMTLKVTPLRTGGQVPSLVGHNERSCPQETTSLPVDGQESVSPEGPPSDLSLYLSSHYFYPFTSLFHLLSSSL